MHCTPSIRLSVSLSVPPVLASNSTHDDDDDKISRKPKVEGEMSCVTGRRQSEVKVTRPHNVEAGNVP